MIYKHSSLFNSISIFYKLASSPDLKEILDNLSSLETFKDKIDYAEKHLEHLSSGSSRIIYLTPDHQVLKLAKNERGIAQNKVESQNMGTKYINRTIKFDKKGSWKISPFCQKITEKQFEEMMNFPFKDFGDALSYGLRSVSENSDKEKPKDFEAISKNEMFQQLVKAGKEFKLLAGDLSRISSYGQIDGHPIILDSGLTKDIYTKFYTSKE